MNIWVDLANSPHVVFFLPIVQALTSRGHTVHISLRDFAQTVPLARKYGLRGEVVGRHGGAGKISKACNLLGRTAQLLSYAAGRHIDIAVSHNSYTHTLAGRILGAKVITIMDYEGQPANNLAFRVAHKVIVPRAFPRAALKKFGAGNGKTYRYEGFKEQLYLSDFRPDHNFAAELREACRLQEDDAVEDKVLVSVRTPPTMALYHNFENAFFDQLLDRLDRDAGALSIVLPRDETQRDYITNRYKNVHVPAKPLDGMGLCYFSDAVISAGGTMNREAAILGTPVYSTFMGAMPAVDRELIRMGRMVHLEKEADLGKIRLRKKVRGRVLRNAGLLDEIVEQILA